MPLPKELSSIKRFGARYGRTVKHKFALIEKMQRMFYKCPYCFKKKVKRISAGIWQCRKCGSKFAGKAYTLSKKKLTAEELFAMAGAEPVEEKTIAEEEIATEAEVIRTKLEKRKLEEEKKKVEAEKKEKDSEIKKEIEKKAEKKTQKDGKGAKKGKK